ncbi:hypothetical protein, partial [Bartonella senegalensis]|uniref:hypothetical protein n=1 Tax=Bartonella senegalensis TaxID=1468418 RepID=UPI000556B422
MNTIIEIKQKFTAQAGERARSTAAHDEVILFGGQILCSTNRKPSLTDHAAFSRHQVPAPTKHPPFPRTMPPIRITTTTSHR